MPYRKEVAICGHHVEVKKYYTFNVGGEHRARGRKYLATPENKKAINRKKSEENLRRIILTNFNHGDLWLTFTFEREPEGEGIEKINNAKRIWRNFMVKLRKWYGQNGIDPKYVYRPEYIGHRVHFHMLLTQGITLKELERLWGQGYIGYNGLKPYVGNYEDAANLAGYMTKESKKNLKEGIPVQRWVGSRNLEKPEIHKETIERYDQWDDDPTPPKGCQRVGTVENGVNVMGYPYQLATYCFTNRKDLNKKYSKKKGGGKHGRPVRRRTPGHRGGKGKKTGRTQHGRARRRSDPRTDKSEGKENSQADQGDGAHRRSD